MDHDYTSIDHGAAGGVGIVSCTRSSRTVGLTENMTISILAAMGLSLTAMESATDQQFSLLEPGLLDLFGLGLASLPATRRGRPLP